MWLMIIKVVFVYFMCLVPALTFEDTTSLFYLSFVGSISTDPSLSSATFASTKAFTDLLTRDDSPFSPLSLPWEFNFLGENVRLVYISPNGAVHSSKKQPCAPENTFATTVCDFQNAYFGVIGGILTDLNPGKSSNGSITASLSSSNVTIRYSNINVFGTTLENSFRITLFPDGHIEIAYDNFQNAIRFFSKKYFSSGLRITQDNKYVHITETQATSSREQWFSDVDGVYPSVSDVVTGNQFTICPVSRSWCLSPSILSRNLSSSNCSSSSSSSSIGSVLVMSTLLISCVDELEFGIIWRTATLPGTPTLDYSLSCSSTNSANGTYYNVSNNNTNADEGDDIARGSLGRTQIRCDIESMLNVTNGVRTEGGAFVIFVWPAWRRRDDSIAGSFTAMSVLPMNVTIVESDDDYVINSTNSSADRFLCSSNVQAGAACADNVCALCSQNYTCFNATCATSDITSNPNGDDPTANIARTSTLFNRLNCNGTCPNTTATDTITTATTAAIATAELEQIVYEADRNDVCCVASDMDCSGVCGGVAVLAINTYGDQVCCESEHEVDCSGVCRNAVTVVEDGCGVCGGTDINGDHCFDAFNRATSMAYLSYVSPITSAAPTFDTSAAAAAADGEEEEVRVLSDLLTRDDSPFSPLSLPWEFNVLGKNVRLVYVSPNGAIHASKEQPCYPSNNFASDACTVGGRYYQVIGGVLTDLNPADANASTATIAVVNSADNVTVLFQNIPLFGSDLLNSFRITLFADHHIEIAYDSIQTTNAAANGYFLPGRWLSGLRSAPDSELVGRKYAEFSGQQRAVGVADWGSSIDGVYPAVSDVVTGNQFTICPVSRSWCLSPNILSRNLISSNSSSSSSSSSSIGGVLVLSTLLISCVDELEFGIILVPRAHDSTAGNISVSCSVATPIIPPIQDEPQIQTGAQLVCNMSSLLETHQPQQLPQLGTGVYMVYPAWRTPVSNASAVPLGWGFSAIPTIDHLEVTVTNGTNGTSSSSNTSGGNSCGEFEQQQNHCSSNVRYEPCLDNVCALCSQNYTCLGAPCTSQAPTTSSSSQDTIQAVSIFDRLNCNGTCPNTTATDTITTATTAAIATAELEQIVYEADRNDVCCVASDMDCSGVCGGVAVLAINTYGDQVCCESEHEVDCSGVCSNPNPVLVDSCGICGGTGECVSYRTHAKDSRLYPIFNLSESDVETNDNFIASSDSSSGLIDTLWVEVSNDSPLAIAAYLTEAETTKNFAPVLNFTSGLLHLAPNGSTGTAGSGTGTNSSVGRLYFNASIASLYSGAISEWRVKEVHLVYYAYETANPSLYTHLIALRPTTVNCRRIASAGTCIRLPGCIYCVDYPDMRILRGSSGASAGAGAGPGINSNSNNDDDVYATDLQQQQQQSSAGQRLISFGGNKVAQQWHHHEQSQQQQRQLFAEFFPDILRREVDDSLDIEDEEEEDGGGVCGDGWTTESCVRTIAPDAYSAASSVGTSRSRLTLPAVVLVVALLTTVAP